MDTPHATVETTIRQADDPQEVLLCLENIFPGVDFSNYESKIFPADNTQINLKFDDVNLENFLEKISKQRILDTALDAMGKNLHLDETFFSLNRQAAMSGKVAFVLAGERVSSGTIDITLNKLNLAVWIEEATWHQGRIDYPRSLSDELTMRNDGGASEWIDPNQPKPQLEIDDEK